MATWVLRTDNGTACCPDSINGYPNDPPLVDFNPCECACNDDSRWAAKKAEFTSIYGGLGLTIKGPGWGGINQNSVVPSLYQIVVYMISKAPVAGCDGACWDYDYLNYSATVFSNTCSWWSGPCATSGALYGPASSLPCQCFSSVPSGSPCPTGGYYMGPVYQCVSGPTTFGSLRAGCVEGCRASAPAEPYPTNFANFYRGIAYANFGCGSPPWAANPCGSPATTLYVGTPQGSDWLIAYYIGIAF